MGVLTTFLGFVGALTIVSQILFAIEVDCMLVGLNGEDRIVKSDGSTGFASVDVIDF
jgi:hypothetical protein